MQSAGRYARGVRRLNPVIVSGLHAVLAQNPGIGNAEIARRLGVSRQTVIYYRRALRTELEQLVARDEEVKKRVVMDQLDLVDRVTEAADDVRHEIQKLKSSDPDPVIASTRFRGHNTLNQIHRLLGELIGEVSPPTTNIFLTRMDAFVSSDDVMPEQLPENLRARLAGGR